MTTWEYAHQRGKGIIHRLAQSARTAQVNMARRRLGLPVAGLVCFTTAAFTVSTLAGLLTAGVACFFLEWRAR